MRGYLLSRDSSQTYIMPILIPVDELPVEAHAGRGVVAVGVWPVVLHRILGKGWHEVKPGRLGNTVAVLARSPLPWKEALGLLITQTTRQGRSYVRVDAAEPK